MTIHLSGHREQVILSLLRAGKFATSDEVIDEALRLVGERYQAPEEANKPAGGDTGTNLLTEPPDSSEIFGDWARNWIPCPRPPLPMASRIGIMIRCSTGNA